MYQQPKGATRMTKSEQREIDRIKATAHLSDFDTMARALSTLYRAARTAKSRDEIYNVIYAYGAYKSTEFII
jgi:hypothetical protein